MNSLINIVPTTCTRRLHSDKAVRCRHLYGERNITDQGQIVCIKRNYVFELSTRYREHCAKYLQRHLSATKLISNISAKTIPEARHYTVTGVASRVAALDYVVVLFLCCTARLTGIGVRYLAQKTRTASSIDVGESL